VRGAILMELVSDGLTLDDVIEHLVSREHCVSTANIIGINAVLGRDSGEDGGEEEDGFAASSQPRLASLLAHRTHSTGSAHNDVRVCDDPQLSAR
jgi:hypothetical protein